MTRVLRPNKSFRAGLLSSVLLVLLTGGLWSVTSALHSLGNPSNYLSRAGHFRNLRASLGAFLEPQRLSRSQVGAGGNSSQPSQTPESPPQSPEAALISTQNVSALLAAANGDEDGQEGQHQQQLPGELHEPDSSSCKVSIPVKKVALMFLTTGQLPHEQLWAEWLEQVAGKLPLRALDDPGAFCIKRCKQGVCSRQCGPQAACSPLCAQQLAAQFSRPSNVSVLDRQHLFSIYVHAPPTWPGYPQGSLFSGTLVPRRVVTVWGSHSLMIAERRLLEAATADRTNAWFVLISDSTVPLYPPTVLWHQLMSETKSKINTCRSKDQSDDRWSRFMETATFKKEHWRKSSQWFMLMRRHAEMVLADREVNLSFMRHCRSGFDRFLGRWRPCVSDEHVIPSLLASLGEADRTNCEVDGSTYVNWSQGGDHPKSFPPGEVTKDLVERMRLCKDGCRDPRLPAAAMAAATASFASLEDLLVPPVSTEGAVAAASTNSQRCQQVMQQAASSRNVSTVLHEMCTLLARKFPAAAAPAMLALYHDCGAGLGVLPCVPSSVANDSTTNVSKEATAAANDGSPDGAMKARTAANDSSASSGGGGGRSESSSPIGEAVAAV